RGRVADDQHDRVPELLDRPELHQRDRVPDVQVGRARVHPELHPQGLLRLEAELDALGELALLDQVDDAALADGELLLDLLAHRACGGHGRASASKPAAQRGTGLFGLDEEPSADGSFARSAVYSILPRRTEPR